MYGEGPVAPRSNGVRTAWVEVHVLDPRRTRVIHMAFCEHCMLSFEVYDEPGDAYRETFGLNSKITLHNGTKYLAQETYDQLSELVGLKEQPVHGGGAG